jgi:hypothetical protein
VVDDRLAVRLVEAGSQMSLGHGQTHGIADTLAQGTWGTPKRARRDANPQEEIEHLNVF